VLRELADVVTRFLALFLALALAWNPWISIAFLQVEAQNNNSWEQIEGSKTHCEKGAR